MVQIFSIVIFTFFTFNGIFLGHFDPRLGSADASRRGASRCANRFTIALSVCLQIAKECVFFNCLYFPNRLEFLKSEIQDWPLFSILYPHANFQVENRKSHFLYYRALHYSEKQRDRGASLTTDPDYSNQPDQSKCNSFSHVYSVSLRENTVWVLELTIFFGAGLEIPNRKKLSQTCKVVVVISNYGRPGDTATQRSHFTNKF